MNTDPYISLVENAVEGIFRTSPEGGYIYANPSLARIYGYASPDELKNSVTDIVKQLYVDPSRRSQFVEQIERTGEVRDFISEIWRKDKTKIWIEENARVIRRADGAVECYEGFVTDVTEKMTMIERFRRSERLESLGQLATGIAHDLNNMLGAMRGYAELLSAPDCEKENLRRYAEIIVQASERGADITRKLLSFSKRDERKMRLSEINKIVGEVVGLLERSVRRDIKVELRLSATRSSAYCDPSLLSNAILNLAVNARDAMPSGGSLVISTSNVRLDAPFRWCRPAEFRSGDFIKIGVSDTGCGIDLEKAGRIFEPFYTTKEQGTGMGLAGVYATVRSHGGSIEVRSKPGEGSVFSIYIPLEAKTALLDARSNALSPARAEMVRGAGRIIVADDNELNLAFMSEMLRGIGYDVIPCEDGRQVMERYKSGWRDFAMAILDVDMPEMDGVAAFKAMRSINPSAKAIFVTGLTDSRKSQEAAGAGAVALIRKPFDPRELSRKIAAAIDE